MRLSVRQAVAGVRTDGSAVPSADARRRGVFSAAAVVAVAAGLAVTGCAATAIAAPAAGGGQPSRGATAGVAVQQTAADLSPSQASAATASGIPWSQVGAGWALAQYTKGSYKRAAAVSLYLVSPAGHAYVVHRWPATKSPLVLVAWSGDKKRVLLQDFDGKARLCSN